MLAGSLLPALENVTARGVGPEVGVAPMTAIGCLPACPMNSTRNRLWGSADEPA